MILSYDTIFLDLDETIWSGCFVNFWAKRLRGALTHFYKDDTEYIYDELGNYIALNSDIKQFLSELVHNYNKQIIYISRGKLHDIPLEKQPSYIALNMFNVLHLFKTGFLIYKDENKGNLITPMGKTIFIDDNTKDLGDVQKKHNTITCLNRNKFYNWKDLYGCIN